MVKVRRACALHAEFPWRVEVSHFNLQRCRETALQLYAVLQSMNESLKVPHMNIGDEYDVTRLSSIRQVLNKELASENVKLSLTAFLIKAMSIAMDEYPIVNSKFNATTQNSVSV